MDAALTSLFSLLLCSCALPFDRCRYPTDPKKALHVDEVIGFHDDLWGMIRPSILVMRDPKLSKKEATRRQMEMRKELADEKLPAMLGHYEKMLASSGTGYFVGSTPTVADMAVFAQLRTLQAGFLDGERTGKSVGRCVGVGCSAKRRMQAAELGALDRPAS